MSMSKIIISKEQSTANPSFKDDPTIELQERIIDNPAKGNCGYYAFAIGLINIIQQEGTGITFDKWVQLDPSIKNYYDAICKFDFDNPDNKLLEVLQRTLRLITYNLQIDELRWACTSAKKEDEYRALVAISTYRKFAEMYHGTDLDPRFNQFVSSVDIKNALKKIDHSRIVAEHESLVLAPLFISLIYGEEVAPETITVSTEPKFNSPIILALHSITQDFVWATHLELDYLANAFEVNLHTLENGVQQYEYKDLPSQHTITLNNQHNMHWTTKVTMAKSRKSSAQPGDSSGGSALGLSSKKIKAIDSEPHVKKQTREEKDAIALTIQDEDLQKTKTGTQKKTEPVRADVEIKQNKKRGKLQEFSSKPSLFRQREEISLALITSNAEQKELNRLIRIVNRAVVDYCSYSDGILFSIFHRHGESGRRRARKFNGEFSLLNKEFSKINGEFSSITALIQAKEMLIDYLKDGKNGRTHPHSFRTMLLQGLLTNKLEREMDLKYVSKNYSNLLAEFEELLIPHRGHQYIN
ncbi:hypothetical protein DGG96_03435 [Legionella qingyii]|uniref:Dot/Icm T4SS effector n=1 Tax=Legionella qingyii TaxID=2184757 RepID=A0A317U4Y6_9GAMM|nr:hypothetical protein [Legionella qingyii]PWY57054.1 hypothetical protein DGG96_03435 [Legionella qingyii]RUR26415.1 hypothetical protein ELY20_00395 [Legionella qingyii]